MADHQQLEQPRLDSTHRAVSTTQSSARKTAPYLDQTQQSLLVAALNSQRPGDKTAAGTDAVHQNITFLSDDMTSFDTQFTPDLLDLDDGLDFDNADLGGQMIGALDDGDDYSHMYEQHEKRKIEDDDDAEEGGAKRQETQEKGAKKPGRKPLTSEPTTKRKAQNRAAQRAFRERKEAHLKDLETKVSELTKAQEADKHENGLLRAQVERLQTELRDYRKRLSLNSSGAKRSPTMTAQNASNMSFNFDFPKFGSLPNAQVLTNNNITPPLSTYSPTSNSYATQTAQASRHNSETRSMSPATQTQPASRVSSFGPGLPGMLPYSTADNMYGFSGTLPQMGKTVNDPFGDLFSPSILKSVQEASSSSYFNQAGTDAIEPTANGGDSTAGIPDNRVFRFNSQSVASDTASPSMSSLSHGHTATSSCGTSPEPINDSPATKLKQIESVEVSKPQNTFAALANPTTDLNLNYNNFSVPQLESFDPVLFGDYRDTNDSIVGGGDFTGGFFDDSFNSAPLDFGSPSNLFGILSPSITAPQISKAATPSHTLLADVEKARDGGDDDYGLPPTQPQQKPETGKLISCTKIWSQLQSNPDFQDGKFDLDGLCAELRTKARCSESGLLVDSSHVDEALKKLTSTAPPTSKYKGGLMFEQESWDNVMKKINAKKQ